MLCYCSSSKLVIVIRQFTLLLSVCSQPNNVLTILLCKQPSDGQFHYLHFCKHAAVRLSYDSINTVVVVMCVIKLQKLKLLL